MHKEEMSTFQAHVAFATKKRLKRMWNRNPCMQMQIHTHTFHSAFVYAAFLCFISGILYRDHYIVGCVCVCACPVVPAGNLATMCRVARAN